MRRLPVIPLSKSLGKTRISNIQVLLVEDDATLAAALKRSLERVAMDVQVCASGLHAVAHWQHLRPHIVLLDLTLPQVDGLDVLRHARDAGLKTPVLILTARGTVGDRIVGLNAGADDYLPKPFDLDELEARIRALVRRTASLPQAPDTKVTVGTLTFDKAQGAIYFRHQLLELTPRELALLGMLMGHHGQAVAKERLFSAVFPDELDVHYEAIEVVVYRLRKKLTDTGVTLVTLRGLGYLLKASL
ncbi:MAG: two-component system response regulator [Burkholderiales bacterium PBB3]|nr:MAG: two-component system response regulator [Burkholderiales bacterium PBB3]